MIDLLMSTVWYGAPAWIANAATAVFWYFLIARWRILPATPLDGGRRLGRHRILGDSRTVAGSAFIVLCAGTVGWLQGDPRLGFMLGLFALAGTLASSFVKRRLGMKEGTRSVLDHVDYALAVIIGLSLLDVHPPGFSAVYYLVFVFGFQATANAAAAAFGIRSAALHAASAGRRSR